MVKELKIYSIKIHGIFKPINYNWNVFILYIDYRVLYFSLHRYDYGKFWPRLRVSDFDYIGEEEGKGYNINLPLNKVIEFYCDFIIYVTLIRFLKGGFGNSEYLLSFYNLLLPIAYEVNYLNHMFILFECLLKLFNNSFSRNWWLYQLATIRRSEISGLLYACLSSIEYC